MPLILAGVSHHKTPIEIRERLHFAEKGLHDSLARLARYNGLSERLILSTCNRMEVYSFAEEFDAGVRSIRDFISESRGVQAEELRKHLYVCRDEDAVRHLFRVTSSLDSMVVGEPQILGQVKEAYRIANEGGHTGKSLSAVFPSAFRVAKKVRERTAIGESAVSVGTVAAELAEKIFSRLEGRTILLLGAGEMCELAARHLMSRGASTILVGNRTYARAEALAAELNGRAVRFDRVAEELVGADIVIASTGAPHLIVKKEMLAEALRKRRDAPIFLIDIAVPRDIDPEVNSLENVFLYDIDDLQAVVTSNLEGREAEAESAGAIVEDEIQGFVRRMRMEDLSKTFSAIRVGAEAQRQGELQKTFSRLASLGEPERSAIDAMSRALVNKLLHHPFSVLRGMAADEIGDESLAMVKRLFGVKEESGGKAHGTGDGEGRTRDEGEPGFSQGTEIDR